MIKYSHKIIWTWLESQWDNYHNSAIVLENWMLIRAISSWETCDIQPGLVISPGDVWSSTDLSASKGWSNIIIYSVGACCLILVELLKEQWSLLFVYQCCARPSVGAICAVEPSVVVSLVFYLTTSLHLSAWSSGAPVPRSSRSTSPNQPDVSSSSSCV